MSHGACLAWFSEGRCAPQVLTGWWAGPGDRSFLEAPSPLSWTPCFLVCLHQAVLHLALGCSLHHIDLSRSVSYENLPWLLTGQSQTLFPVNSRPFTSQALPLACFFRFISSPFSIKKPNSLCSSRSPSARLLLLPHLHPAALTHPSTPSPNAPCPVLPFLLTEGFCPLRALT